MEPSQERLRFLFFSRHLFPDVDPYNVSVPNHVPIIGSVPNIVPINAFAPNNSSTPVFSAHLEDPSNDPTELQAARNFHFEKRLRMRVGPGKS